jgi:hypothetical protein
MPCKTAYTYSLIVFIVFTLNRCTTESVKEPVGIATIYGLDDRRVGL